MPEDATSQLIINFLDKMLDENIKCAQNLSSLKFNIDEQRDQIEKMSDETLITFKNEIKKSIVEESIKIRESTGKIFEKFAEFEKKNEEDKERLENIDQIIVDFKKRAGFLKYLAIILTSIATIIGGIATFTKVINWGDDAKNQNIVQPKGK